MKPLVSILIPAYNAERTIGETLWSAVSQTWEPKEIVVANDGSTDRTSEIASQFKGVTVVSSENRGLSGAQNNAFRHSKGDYIQYLDADDLLAPDKIERQIVALQKASNNRKLASSPWAKFYYRTRPARFVQNSLCESFSPVEWLLRKMRSGDHMQNATWLVRREIAEQAGPWDENLHYDQDGEFFARVLLASEGTIFVPGTGIYYRSSGSSSVSFIGNSDKKKESLLRSIKLHIQYLRSLEESDRVRQACVAYMQYWYEYLYHSRADIVASLQELAQQLRGHLEPPFLRAKYAWMRPIVGYEAARRAQMIFPNYKATFLRAWDKTLFGFERSTANGHH